MVVVEDRTNNGAGRIDELAQVHGMEQLQLGNVDHVDPTLLTQEEIGVVEAVAEFGGGSLHEHRCDTRKQRGGRTAHRDVGVQGIESAMLDFKCVYHSHNG